MRRRRLVRVPSSSANLGPGFDAFACAIALHLELEVEETGRFGVHTELSIARDRRNLAVRGFARLASPDTFSFRIRSQIPLSGGLGSSAAAYVAGLLAADHVFELDADVLALATELEGHPDNVAAALPANVPMGDAVFNVSHGALLVLGLARGDLDLVARGLDDRLHQPHREHLFPRSMRLVRRARSLGALGATISGAGPTVLVWCHYDATASVVDALRREADGWATVMRAPFEPQGADVREL